MYCACMYGFGRICVNKLVNFDVHKIETVIWSHDDLMNTKF